MLSVLRLSPRFVRSVAAGVRYQSAAAASVLEEGKKLQMTWQDGFSSEFHARWLRHNCRCPACWNPNSSQKIMSHVELQGEHMRVETVEVEDGQVTLKWTNENGWSHKGQLGVAWLRDNEYSEQTLSNRVVESRPKETRSLPMLSYARVQAGDTGLYQWLSMLSDHGVCLLTGVPLDHDKVKELATMIGPVTATHYGQVWDVKSEDKALNLAYTNSYLPLHVDMAYLESPPGIQLLHCLRNDPQVVGGDSILLDGWAVAERMRHSHPEQFELLTRIPATFDKVQPTRNSIRHRRPHIVLDRDGEVVGFNWSPQNHGPLSIRPDEVEPYYRAYNVLAALLEESQDKIYHLLKPGDLLSFNNRRFLHSRNEYIANGGMRVLRGCYVSGDDFKSKVRLLTEELEPGRVVRSVLNRCTY